MRFADTVYLTAIYDCKNTYISFFRTVVTICSSQLVHNVTKKLKLCILRR